MHIRQMVFGVAACHAVLVFFSFSSSNAGKKYALAAEGSKQIKNSTDPWEDEGKAPNNLDFKACDKINSVLILPVPVSERAEAIALLQDFPIFELDQQSASKMLSLNATTEVKTLPLELTGGAIAKLEEQKRLELEEQKGSWGRILEERLDELQTLGKGPRILTLRPFIVRAIAKNESTGTFMVSLCNDDLLVCHGSLGHSVPPSSRLPIVVFLEKKPKNVYLGWTMAE